MTQEQYRARIRIYKAASVARLLSCLTIIPALIGVISFVYTTASFGWVIRLSSVLAFCIAILVILLGPIWVGILCGLRCRYCGKGLLAKEVAERGKCHFCGHPICDLN